MKESEFIDLVDSGSDFFSGTSFASIERNYTDGSRCRHIFMISSKIKNEFRIVEDEKGELIVSYKGKYHRSLGDMEKGGITPVDRLSFRELGVSGRLKYRPLFADPIGKDAQGREVTLTLLHYEEGSGIGIAKLFCGDDEIVRDILNYIDKAENP